jgi:hypothetical protein
MKFERLTYHNREYEGTVRSPALHVKNFSAYPYPGTAL